MPDHYRTLVQSLMQMGFLFRRVTERKEEVWRNRLTDQEVTFDRKEVTSSPAAAARVVKDAKNAKPGAESAEPAAAPARAARQNVRTAAAPRAKTGRSTAKGLKATPKARGAAKPRKAKLAAKPKARAKSRTR